MNKHGFLLLILLLSMNVSYSVTSQNQSTDHVGIVYPLFTKTAYTEGSFYDFFDCYQEELTCDLNATNDLLHTELIESEITDYMRSIATENMNYEFITDLDVHNNNISRFNTLVFFHSEYVTQNQYDNVINFIEQGKKVLLLSGNSFFAKIRYFDQNNSIQLLHGHSVYLNETMQYEVDINRYWFGFYNSSNIENSYAYKYIGSRFKHYKSGIFFRGMSRLSDYGNIMTGFSSHEENTVINSNVEIMIDWITSFDQHDMGIKTYLYRPFNNSGHLIYLGLYFEKIHEDEIIKDFVHYLINTNWNARNNVTELPSTTITVNEAFDKQSSNQNMAIPLLGIMVATLVLARPIIRKTHPTYPAS